MINSSNQFDSFEKLGGFQSNLALTTKNSSHNHFNSKFKSPERTSLVSNNQITRNTLNFDADSLQSRDAKDGKPYNHHHNKIHQKILKLTDQASTLNNQSSASIIMQNSISNGNLKKGARL
jgi:hypothetical protein